MASRELIEVRMVSANPSSFEGAASFESFDRNTIEIGITDRRRLVV